MEEVNQTGQWSKEEIIKLLEKGAANEFDSIANELGKTPEQCAL
jgi:hypothetical protein